MGEKKEAGAENDLKKGGDDAKEKNTGGKRKRGNKPALQRKEEARQHTSRHKGGEIEQRKTQSEKKEQV